MWAQECEDLTLDPSNVPKMTLNRVNGRENLCIPTFIQVYVHNFTIQT